MQPAAGAAQARQRRSPASPRLPSESPRHMTHLRQVSTGRRGLQGQGFSLKSESEAIRAELVLYRTTRFNCCANWPLPIMMRPASSGPVASMAMRRSSACGTGLGNLSDSEPGRAGARRDDGGGALRCACQCGRAGALARAAARGLRPKPAWAVAGGWARAGAFPASFPPRWAACAEGRGCWLGCLPVSRGPKLRRGEFHAPGVCLAALSGPLAARWPQAHLECAAASGSASLRAQAASEDSDARPRATCPAN